MRRAAAATHDPYFCLGRDRIGKREMADKLTIVGSASLFFRWSRRYNPVAAGGDERFNTFLDLVAVQEPSAPAMVPEVSGTGGASRQAMQTDSRMIMNTETGTEAHCIVDSAQGDNWLKVWRRLVQRFHPASAQTNLNLMRSVLKPPRGKIDHISFLMDNWEETARRQDDRAGGQVLTDDTTWANLMDTRAEFESKHKLIQTQPTLAELAPQLVELNPTLADPDLNLLQADPSSVGINPAWSSSRQSWSNPSQMWQHPAQVGKRQTKYGRTQAKVQMRSNCNLRGEGASRGPNTMRPSVCDLDIQFPPPPNTDTG